MGNATSLKKGRFTLPAEAGMDSTVKMLIDKWGADAVRDSDGTALAGNHGLRGGGLLHLVPHPR